MKTKIQQLIIATILMAGCSTDSAINPIDNCKNFTFPTSGFGPFFSEGRYQFKTPCYNPNNSDEFCYIFLDNESGKIELCKYVISQNHKELILEDYQIILQPKWSKKDWILFNTIDHNLWKIKSNGDSLTQLTTLNNSLYPEWNPDGTKIISHSEEIMLPEAYIYDEFGNTIDTLLGSSYILGSWSQDDKIVTLNGGRDAPNLHYSPIDLANWTQITDYSGEIENRRVEDIKWHPNTTQVFFTRLHAGIFIANVTQMEEQQFLIGCDAKYYKTLSFSSDGTTLIVERVNATVENEITVIENSTIAIINMDGYEKDIILPTN